MAKFYQPAKFLQVECIGKIPGVIYLVPLIK